MWGYRLDGIIIATNPSNMSGNSGWEEVPDDTVPVQQTEVTPEQPHKSADERLDTLEPTVDDVVDVLISALGVSLDE